jgi:hypothetical protein
MRFQQSVRISLSEHYFIKGFLILVKHTDSLTLSIVTTSRIVFYILLLLLGSLLFYGLVSLPPWDETNPTFHVASRYLDHSAEETGFSSSFWGVLLDYRSFDLILFNLFFLALTLSILLFCAVENLPIRRAEWLLVWLSLLSSITLFLLGWIGLKSGSNFLDYEFWSFLFGSAARIHGAWITGGLVLLTVCSSLKLVSKIWPLGKEKRFNA